MAQELREKTNTTLLAVAKQDKDDDKWDLYPNSEQDISIRSGDSIILLGNEEEFRSVEKLLGRKSGR